VVLMDRKLSSLPCSIDLLVDTGISRLAPKHDSELFVHCAKRTEGQAPLLERWSFREAQG
jgi:hypothetical protein